MNIVCSSAKIAKLTLVIKNEIKKLASKDIKEDFWVAHFGGLNPNYLVYWICVESDEEKHRLKKSDQLQKILKSLLASFDYPVESRDKVEIRLESQETVDRKSGGNWYHHWK